MKLLLLPFLSAISLSPVSKQAATGDKPTLPSHKPAALTFQDDGKEKGRKSCIEFKAQEYCRAELEDFDFDYHFSIVSASVYFSGANFPNVIKTTIKGPSLKPLKELMNRCAPGSTVSFDDIVVKGSDGAVRTIPGKSWLLY